MNPDQIEFFFGKEAICIEFSFIDCCSPFLVYDLLPNEATASNDEQTEFPLARPPLDTATEKNPEGRRPKEFDSNKGLLLVFKREKK